MSWHCTSACGWVAAIISALAFGSYGVPIKSGKSNKVNVDPLVMQSYKTCMLLLTCWFVLLMGEDCSLTPWGLASGCFAIPGGTAGIYGIRNAGLAIAVGIWSSLIVISSFGWGIFVFDEKVRSIPGAFVACLLLMVGLIGMARYSSPSFQTKPSQVAPGGGGAATPASGKLQESPVKEATPPEGTAAKKRKAAVAAAPTSELLATAEDKDATTAGMAPLEMEPLVDAEDARSDSSTALLSDAASESGPGGHRRPPLSDAPLVLFNGRLILSRRQLGILGAIFNGVWGGTSMIPMHYANAEGFGGARYIISFSCGSSVICVIVWILRYLYQVYASNYRYREAYNSLPSFHVKDMWLQGMLAGALYSLGNFSSIFAITYLGQGVGYSVVQSAMLVSGLWGIFFFGEIRGAEIISKWLLAAVITIAGILLLSHEHVDSGGGGH